MVWKQIAVLSTLCFVDVFLFPFDRHACKLQLASFDFRTSSIFLGFLETPYEGTQHSQGDWRIVTTNRYDFVSTGEDQEFNIGLNFIISVERYPGHYIMIIIVPTVLIVVLTFVTFFLPLKSGVRIGYILTVVLAMVVLLTLFADTMPTSSQYPSILGKVSVIIDMFVHSLISSVYLKEIHNSLPYDLLS
ncbi:unnamed protein product [Mytilus edulis]|uniref:Neurotransmitter-gated ion-channel ligand-binding domain-containing protein n=1 Tax=Mytilus edulis TaxID=6550 RepID=A0A8S3RGU9_MYTED|nr:unnamed protein product [Mytilus edulis]